MLREEFVGAEADVGLNMLTGWPGRQSSAQAVHLALEEMNSEDGGHGISMPTSALCRNLNLMSSCIASRSQEMD